MTLSFSNANKDIYCWEIDSSDFGIYNLFYQQNLTVKCRLSTYSDLSWELRVFGPQEFRCDISPTSPHKCTSKAIPFTSSYVAECVPRNKIPEMMEKISDIKINEKYFPTKSPRHQTSITIECDDGKLIHSSKMLPSSEFPSFLSREIPKPLKKSSCAKPNQMPSSSGASGGSSETLYEYQPKSYQPPPSSSYYPTIPIVNQTQTPPPPSSSSETMDSFQRAIRLNLLNETCEIDNSEFVEGMEGTTRMYLKGGRLTIWGINQFSCNLSITPPHKYTGTGVEQTLMGYRGREPNVIKREEEIPKLMKKVVGVTFTRDNCVNIVLDDTREIKCRRVKSQSQSSLREERKKQEQNYLRERKELKTKLLSAIENGDIEFVRENLNDKNSFSDYHNLFCVACKHGGLPIVEFLGKEMTRYAERDTHNKSYPFEIACKNGHLPIIKYLCEHVAPPSKPGGFNPCAKNNALFKIALQNNRMDIVEYLNSVTGNVFKTCSQFTDVCKKGNLSQIKLLTGSTDTNPKENDYEALVIASAFGHTDIVKFLCMQYPPNTKELEKAYRVASQNGRVAVVAYLETIFKKEPVKEPVKEPPEPIKKKDTVQSIEQALEVLGTYLNANGVPSGDDYIKDLEKTIAEQDEKIQTLKDEIRDYEIKYSI